MVTELNDEVQCKLDEDEMADKKMQQQSHNVVKMTSKDPTMTDPTTDTQSPTNDDALTMAA
eukprot:scaffold82190_cov27-Attheya_sp.AAC.1